MILLAIRMNLMRNGITNMDNPEPGEQGYYRNPEWCDDVNWLVPNFKAILYSDYYIRRIHGENE